MSRNYTIQTRINKPVAEVFAALVDGGTMMKYFTDSNSGDLVEDADLIWWGDHPVKVRTVKTNELIELLINSRQWKKSKDESYEVLVSFEFAGLEDGSTMLSISESGWKTNKDGLKGSHDNCGGWQHMAMCLKAYLEYGIDLR